MVRKIVHIDQGKCNGCGACAGACHEGAIEMVDGKAVLTREDFCDGFGDCLPECPAGAITFEEREAPAYDAEAVAAAKRSRGQDRSSIPGAGGCPGSRTRDLGRRDPPEARDAPAAPGRPVSRLGQWPVQIKLVPIRAPFFDGADLLIAADCTAYACAGMREELMKGRVTLIGCPKLDGVDYADKLTEILRENDIRSVTVVRMEVPCCGGLLRAAEKAFRESGRRIPWRAVTVSIDGRILDDQTTKEGIL